MRVSQGTDFFASRTEASTSSAASVGGGGSVNDPAAAAQAVQDALDINWLLRALGQTGEEDNPMRPAAGDQNQPMQPTNPQGENQDTEESVQSGRVSATFVNAMFAEQSYEEPDLSPSLLGPGLLHVDSHSGTRLNAGWAS